MGNIYTRTEQLVGNTPLLELGRLAAGEGLSARLLAKLEFFNPAGSVKDRAALAMVEDAERRGLLSPGGTGTLEGLTFTSYAGPGWRAALCSPGGTALLEAFPLS